MIDDLEESTDLYFNAHQIITDLKESIVRNIEGPKNTCISCGRDMGRCNPRQLCGKTKCDFWDLHVR